MASPSAVSTNLRKASTFAWARFPLLREGFQRTFVMWSQRIAISEFPMNPLPIPNTLSDWLSGESHGNVLWRSAHQRKNTKHSKEGPLLWPQDVHTWGHQTKESLWHSDTNHIIMQLLQSGQNRVESQRQSSKTLERIAHSDLSAEAEKWKIVLGCEVAWNIRLFCVSCYSTYSGTQCSCYVNSF